MRENLYCFWDKKVKAGDRVWQSPSDEAAVRTFGDILADKNTMFGRHPEDFALFRIGTYDNVSLEVVGEAKQVVVTGLEVVASIKEVDQGVVGNA